MSDVFVPDADRQEQEREVVPDPTRDDSGVPLVSEVRLTEASEADIWEQQQEVPFDGEYEG